MRSPLLALFIRSLREDARSKAVYWARSGMGAFILLMLAGFAMENTWAGAPGLHFFVGIVILQAVSITFVGLSYFASAVTEEKEEETLGLLRMTDLNPLSILLGKSTSRLCGALLLLACQFPFTVFAVTLGGISLGQIVATYLALGAYMFMLCNIALLGSVLARTTPRAAVFSVAVLIILTWGGSSLDELQKVMPPSRAAMVVYSIAEHMSEGRVATRLISVLSTNFSGSLVGWQVGYNLMIGVVFFLLAWAAFGRFCDRAAEGVAGGAKVSTPGAGMRMDRPPRPTGDPVRWRDFYFLHGGRLAMVLRTMIYGGAFLFVLWKAQDVRMFNMAPVVVGFVGVFVLSLDLAAISARVFRSEIRDQTLTALAGLPCTMRQLAFRKASAGLFAALPGLLAVGAGQVILTVKLMGSTMGLRGQFTAFLSMANGWVVFLLGIHVVAWISLFMKRGAMAVGWVATLALYWLIWMICMVLMTTLVTGIAFGSSSPSGAIWVFEAGPLLALFLCLVLIFILFRYIPSRLAAMAGEG